MDVIIFPDSIEIDKSIKLIKLDSSVDKNALKQNLLLLTDNDIVSFLGFDENIDKETNVIFDRISNSNRDVYYYLLDNNNFIGLFYLYDIEEEYKRANISLGIVPNKRGNILSSNRVKRILKELFNLGFIRLAFEIEDTNDKSLKIARHLENIGFYYEGKLRDNYGININSNIWSILKRDLI